MTGIEALNHFKENYVKKIGQEKLLSLDNYYNNCQDRLATQFADSFRKLCLKALTMQIKGQKGDIMYINYSLLRTNMIERKYTYAAEALNCYSFEDDGDCRIEYDVTWAYQFLHEFLEELEQKRRLYIDKISPAVIDRIMMEELAGYNNYVVKLARLAIPQAVNLVEFKEMYKEDYVEIRVGEYKGTYEVIWPNYF